MNIGDVVMLLSGGPAMTIVGQTANGLLCQWFVNGVLATSEFAEKVLKPAKPDK